MHATVYVTLGTPHEEDTPRSPCGAGGKEKSTVNHRTTVTTLHTTTKPQAPPSGRPVNSLFGSNLLHSLRHPAVRGSWRQLLMQVTFTRQCLTTTSLQISYGLHALFLTKPDILK